MAAGGIFVIAMVFVFAMGSSACGRVLVERAVDNHGRSDNDGGQDVLSAGSGSRDADGGGAVGQDGGGGQTPGGSTVCGDKHSFWSIEEQADIDALADCDEVRGDMFIDMPGDVVLSRLRGADQVLVNGRKTKSFSAPLLTQVESLEITEAKAMEAVDVSALQHVESLVLDDNPKLTISFPVLGSAGRVALLRSAGHAVTFPALAYVTEALVIANTTPADLVFPMLQEAASVDVHSSNTSLTYSVRTVTLPALAETSGLLTIWVASELTAFVAPKLAHIGSVDVFGNDSLVMLSLGEGATVNDGGSIKCNPLLDVTAIMFSSESDVEPYCNNVDPSSCACW